MSLGRKKWSLAQRRGRDAQKKADRGKVVNKAIDGPSSKERVLRSPALSRRLGRRRHKPSALSREERNSHVRLGVKRGGRQKSLQQERGKLGARKRGSLPFRSDCQRQGCHSLIFSSPRRGRQHKVLS